MLQLSDIETVIDGPRETYLYVDEIDKYAHPMLSTLVKEIRDELADAKHKDRRHGARGTHNAGCAGPLCRRGRRLWLHQNYATKRAMKGKSYNPRPSADHELTEPLFALIQAHVDRQFELRKIEAKTRSEIEKALKRVKPDPQPAEPIEVHKSADNSEFVMSPSALQLVVLL